MKKIKSMALKLWRDESGQGTAEYVLILVGVVAVGFIFKDKIVAIVRGKMETLQGEIDAFSTK